MRICASALDRIRAGAASLSHARHARGKLNESPHGRLRHFTDLSKVSATDLRAMLDDAVARKGRLKAGERSRPLDGKVLAMIFDKPSTRTRMSFDVGMRQLGGETIMLTGTEMQLGRAKPSPTPPRCLSRYVDAIMIRTTAHERLLELTEHATVPVINGLTDDTHPCQLMADVMTYRGASRAGGGQDLRLDRRRQQRAAFAAGGFGALRLQAQHRGAGRQRAGGEIRRLGQARTAATSRSPDRRGGRQGADCVVTDGWVSMGQEHRARGHNVFLPYQVNAALMKHAKPDALFMHCLPAHRGEEVTDEVIDGPHSVVFDEAENRLHAQKAVLAWCLGA